MFNKIFDVLSENVYLNTIPIMSEDGKKMVESCSIRIIEAGNQNGATKVLGEKLFSKR